jgi:hypothetical protein
MFVVGIVVRSQQALASTLVVLGAGQIALAALLSKLEGAVELGPAGVKLQLARVQQQLDDVSGQVAELVVSMMYEPDWDNLQKIESDHFGKFTKSKDFDIDLHHLRSLGLIEVESIDDIPEQGPELSRFVTLTAAGRDYIKLRKRIEQSKAAAGAG